MPTKDPSGPAREVVTRSPKRKVGRVNCRWFQSEPIQHESQLEKHFIVRAILFKPLRRITHQPFRMSLGDRLTYTPDFLLRFDECKPIVVEVKHSSKIKPLVARMDQISNLLARDGISFMVIHEGQIRRGERLAQARLVRRYATTAVPFGLRIAVTEALSKSPMTIASLTQVTGITFQQVCALAAQRDIELDPNGGCSSETTVSLIKLESTHASTEFGDWFGAAPWRKDS